MKGRQVYTYKGTNEMYNKANQEEIKGEDEDRSLLE